MSDHELIVLLLLMSVVSYGCETWTRILKEEHRLRVFENRVLGRICGPKREEITDWTKIHNGDVCSTYGE
jgi:hypothetical protein